MSYYLDGLGFGAMASLWLLGALTPPFAAYCLAAALYGPLRGLFWRLHAWRAARRWRRQAAYDVRRAE